MIKTGSHSPTVRQTPVALVIYSQGSLKRTDGPLHSDRTYGEQHATCQTASRQGFLAARYFTFAGSADKHGGGSLSFLYALVFRAAVLAVRFERKQTT